jgi:OpgC protein
VGEIPACCSEVKFRKAGDRNPGLELDRPNKLQHEDEKDFRGYWEVTDYFQAPEHNVIRAKWGGRDLRLQQFVPDAISNLIYPIYKSHLAPVRLLHFLSLALLMYRVKPSQWYRVPKPLLMTTVRCGENSLSIYCLGVLLSFAGLVFLADFPSRYLCRRSSASQASP